MVFMVQSFLSVPQNVEAPRREEATAPPPNAKQGRLDSMCVGGGAQKQTNLKRNPPR
jgi:hypothetical protein